MALKQGSKWSNWSWDKPVKAFIWRSSRICRPTGGLPPWFFEESLPHFLLRNNSILSLDGDVIFSNVDISIDFSQQGMEWRGNFDLTPTSTFDPTALPQSKTFIL